MKDTIPLVVRAAATYTDRVISALELGRSLLRKQDVLKSIGLPIFTPAEAIPKEWRTVKLDPEIGEVVEVRLRFAVGWNVVVIMKRDTATHFELISIQLERRAKVPWHEFWSLHLEGSDLLHVCSITQWGVGNNPADRNTLEMILDRNLKPVSR